MASAEADVKYALLFPGQGSQYVGMGRDLAEAFAAVRELYGRADELLGMPLSRLSWEGPAEELTATENAQPAILLHSYAVWELLRDDLEGRVVAAAGHSLGEFTAHAAAGTFTLEDALRLVRRRGELMARSGAERPGTMAAVLGLDEEVLASLCQQVGDGVVVPANLNAPGQVVISGDVAAVERAAERALADGARRAVPLTVSGAFHSPLMGGVGAGLERALDQVGLADPAFPIVANATARSVTNAAAARETLLAQLTAPVRWVECVERMAGYRPDRWLELGPGRVLSGLLRRIDRSAASASVADVASAEAFLGA